MKSHSSKRTSNGSEPEEVDNDSKTVGSDSVNDKVANLNTSDTSMHTSPLQSPSPLADDLPRSSRSSSKENRLVAKPARKRINKGESDGIGKKTGLSETGHRMAKLTKKENDSDAVTGSTVSEDVGASQKQGGTKRKRGNAPLLGHDSSGMDAVSDSALTSTREVKPAAEPTVKPAAEDDDFVPMPGSLRIEKMEAYDQETAALEDQWAVQYIMDHKMRPNSEGTREMMYRVKWENFDLNYDDKEQWLSKWQFGGDQQMIESYHTRERKIGNVQKALKTRLGISEEEFNAIYPNYKNRKDLEKPGVPVSARQAYLMYIRNWESSIAQQLKITNQAELYIENWTDELAPLDFDYILEVILRKEVLESLTETAKCVRREEGAHLCACTCPEDGDCGKQCECSAVRLTNPIRVEPKGSLHHGDIAKQHVNSATLLACGPLCTCGPNCRRRAHEKGRKVPVMLFYYGKRKGWGLMAVNAIQTGTFLGNYVGELMVEEDYAGKPDNRKNVYKFALPGDAEGSCFDFVIDAGNMGNETRFINHACDPNMIPVNVFIGQNETYCDIAFFSRRTISTGEELTFHYSPDINEKNKKGGRCLCRPLCKSRL